MRPSNEIRMEAMKMLTGTRWFWRIIASYLILSAVNFAVTSGLDHAYASLGVQTWETFAEAYKKAQSAGLDLAVPAGREAWRMTLASSFQTLVQFLFSGIMLFGFVAVLLRCVRNEAEGWFRDSLSGFRQPIAMLWLTLLMTLKVLLWALLFIVPGIIALYRYALAWYIKAENPMLGAEECLERSGAIMEGRKWQLFTFSLWYLFLFLMALIPAIFGSAVAKIAATVTGSADSLVVKIALITGQIVSQVLLVVVIANAGVGQAVFYRDAKAEAESENGANGQMIE